MSLRAPLAALPLLLVLAVLVAGTVTAQSSLTGQVSGPAALAPSQSAMYNLSISGGPSGVVNYTATYYITGSNTTGGSPLSSSPISAKNTLRTFHLNITAPSIAQTITLVVKIEAAGTGSPAENTTLEYSIVVIQPIVLSATFHNGSPTAAVNVTVQWYIDNALVGTTLLSKIAGNADSTVSYNYLPLSLSAGEHTVRVEANLAGGQVVTSTLFYNQVQPTAPGWAILLGIAIFVLVFMLVVALRRRGQT